MKCGTSYTLSLPNRAQETKGGYYASAILASEHTRDDSEHV
jgi:hypothetical protein